MPSPPVSSKMRIADEIVRVTPAAILAAPRTAYPPGSTTLANPGCNSRIASPTIRPTPAPIANAGAKTPHGRGRVMPKMRTRKRSATKVRRDRKPLASIGALAESEDEAPGQKGRLRFCGLVSRLSALTHWLLLTAPSHASGSTCARHCSRGGYNPRHVQFCFKELIDALKGALGHEGAEPRRLWTRER